MALFLLWLIMAVYDVTDASYGATGNGSTDDTDAIASAITAAKNAGGGVIYFPAGTYLTDPITIEGDGNTQAYVALEGDTQIQSKIKLANNSDDYLITINGSNTHFEKIQFDGNKENQSEGGCVYIDNNPLVNSLTFDKCYINDGKDYGIRNVSADQIRFNICRFYRSKVGIKHSNSLACSHRDCLFEDNEQVGLQIQGSGPNKDQKYLIEGCYFENNVTDSGQSEGYHIDFYNMQKEVQVTVRDSYFQGNTSADRQYGIRLHSVIKTESVPYGCISSGNKFSNCTKGAYKLDIARRNDNGLDIHGDTYEGSTPIPRFKARYPGWGPCLDMLPFPSLVLDA